MSVEAKRYLESPEHQTRLVAEQEYSPWLLITDQMVRLAVLIFCLNMGVSAWWILLINVILTVLELAWTTHRRSEVEVDMKERLHPEYKSPNLAFELDSSTPSALMGMYMIGGLVFSYWFLFHVSDNHAWYMHILFLLGALLGTIGFVMVVVSTSLDSRHRENATYLVKVKSDGQDIDVTQHFPNALLRAHELSGQLQIDLDPVDQNDTRIAKLESELKGVNNKVEAYLLESVLLGGLAFSGFLTILSGSSVNPDQLRFSAFCAHASECLVQMRQLLPTQWWQHLRSVFTAADLPVAVMLLCLLSSVFFLLVLTLRMRYMSLSLGMDHLMRTMNIFNAKEEELVAMAYDRHLKDDADRQKRLDAVVKKIDLAINDATHLMDQLNPVVTMMSTCRNSGILCFYGLLAVSGLYFSPAVAFAILGAAVLLNVARRIDATSKFRVIQNIMNKYRK